jgi:hypothetical protein
VLELEDQGLEEDERLGQGPEEFGLGAPVKGARGPKQWKTPNLALLRKSNLKLRFLGDGAPIPAWYWAGVVGGVAGGVTPSGTSYTRKKKKKPLLRIESGEL